jgi:hypothetical protein
LDVLLALAHVAKGQCVDAHDLVGERWHAPHIQAQKLTLVKHALVEDEAVALGCKCDEQYTIQEGLEFVTPASDSGPLIQPLLWMNRGPMEVNDTVGVAVRC